MNNQMRPSNVISNGHSGDTTGRRGGTENVPPAQSSSNSRITQQVRQNRNLRIIF